MTQTVHEPVWNRAVISCLFLLLLLPTARAEDGPDTEPRWWKGNTHTHSLWSDGNAAPEQIAHWYRAHGYHFLVLSDHNILSEGERWFPISGSGSRLTPDHVSTLQHLFGTDWVNTREGGGGQEMRLKTLSELQEAMEIPGSFIFIQGEEITDRYGNAEVHVNGLHLDELVPPQHGDSLVQTIQRNIDAVIEQGMRLSRPVLAHLNHPNFAWSITPEDLAGITGERFFEVYNGHRGTNNHGDASRPGTETMWDIANTLRVTELHLPLLMGIASDDAHNHHGLNPTSTPGRGWVMVQCKDLQAGSLIEAMQAGRFYASSGVMVEDHGHDEKHMWLHIDAEPGVTYTTRFHGTRTTAEGLGPIGDVLAEVTGPKAVYRFRGDELFVRAQITSSRSHPNPFAEGDMETAWLQPVSP